ncbi:MAG: arginine deiminase family protein [Alphaproteobacteria bacterium]|jgi:dimethylargininase|nr:arginine deiminase family protein [Alphaproteobacteria bacterium]
MRIARAIVRQPGSGLAGGLTTATFGPPDLALARHQHRAYVEALEAAGVAVTTLPPLDDFPDSVFVEDVAVCTPHCAVVTRPGAPSRQGEAAHIEAALRDHYEAVARIEAPGRLDGGDVLEVGDHYVVGLTDRTDAEGARQLIAILERHGLSGETLPVQGMLHLKSGVAWLGDDLLLLQPALAEDPAFRGYDKILLAADEAYAANAVVVNDRVLMATGHPKTGRAIENAGLSTVALDVSEFRKLDGGLSCLSLRLAVA